MWRGTARIATLFVLVVPAACSAGRGQHTAGRGATSTTVAATTTTSVPASSVVLLAVHDGELEAIAPNPPFVRQTVVPSVSDSTDGIDANGVLCRDPADPRRLAIGEGGPRPGVALVDVGGAGLGALRARVRARLAVTTTDAEVTGCAFLADGRLAVAEQQPQPGDDHIAVFATGGPTSTCTLDVQVDEPGPMLASATVADGGTTDLDVAVRGAPAVGGGATVLSVTVAADACAVRNVQRLTPDRLPTTATPTALASINGRVWVATDRAELIGIAADTVVERRTAPGGATVRGMTGARDGTVYLTTGNDDNRSGVLWQVAGSRARVLASGWSGTGAVLLYAAPDR